MDREREARNGLEREVPLCADRSEGLGHEGDDQDRDGDDADELPRRVETRQVVQRRRMPNPENQYQEPKEKPTGISWRRKDGQCEKGENRGPGDIELLLPEKRPRDVASVQLPRRQEVDRRHEQPDPTREGERMQGERTRKREEEGEEGEQDRRPDRLAYRVRRKGGRRGRQREAGQRDRDRDCESDERSRHPDVQEGPPVRDGIPHADERTEGAEGRDRRQEERERRPDVVSLGDDVMAHLVASEDRKEGKGEEHGPVADRFGREDRLARVVGPVPSAAEEHDREDRQEEEGDVHLDARKPPL